MKKDENAMTLQLLYCSYFIHLESSYSFTEQTFKCHASIQRAAHFCCQSHFHHSFYSLDTFFKILLSFSKELEQVKSPRYKYNLTNRKGDKTHVYESTFW